MSRELQYKDKKVPRHYCSNTPKTRVVLVLVTVTLLIIYSVLKLDSEGETRDSAESNRVAHTPVKSSSTPTHATYHDADVDYSKHLLDYKKLSHYLGGGKNKETPGNNGMDAESIDTSLDSKVVGSITMDRRLKEEEEARDTAAMPQMQTVKADVTRAYKEEAKTYDTRKTAARNKGGNIKTMAEEQVEEHAGHVVDHLEEGHTTRKSLKKTPTPKKVVVEQIDDGGVRVLDRIDMSS